MEKPGKKPVGFVVIQAIARTEVRCCSAENETYSCHGLEKWWIGGISLIDVSPC